MAEVIALRPTLSDSTFKTRPNFQTFLRTDTNAGLNAIQQIEAKRKARELKYTQISERKDVKSFQDRPGTPSFRKYNDEGDHRAPAPNRYHGTVLDPVTGFFSAGGDIGRQTGVKKVQNFVHIMDRPQYMVPHLSNTSRMSPAAPPELQRQVQSAPPRPSHWNSRKTLDSSTRAKLGGWTSETPVVPEPPKGQLSVQPKYRGPSELSREVRDKLAMQFRYTSSQQRSYEEVPWDDMLASKQWAPTTTFEPKPDQVDPRWSNKRYEPVKEDWQGVGRGWDWFQTRNGNYKKEQMVTFCSPCSRREQIPNYGGCIGASNLGEIDNAQERFDPYTVKRSEVPRPAETAHRPNIPGYQGCTLYESRRTAAHSDTPPQQTTAVAHSVKPAAENTVKRESQISKMVTLVPPYNPFNQLDKVADTLAAKRQAASAPPSSALKTTTS